MNTQALEYCFICEHPTGRAGRADDSLYDNYDYGSYCENCWYEERIWVGESKQLQAENERLANAVKWYGERAQALTKCKDKGTHYLEAIYVELSLDGGNRAREALIRRS